MGRETWSEPHEEVDGSIACRGHRINAKQRSGASSSALTGGRSICRMQYEMVEQILESLITCPNCGFERLEVMPLDACVFFYECTQCKVILRPQEGDCCVFCSYGTVPCPPIQDDSDAPCAGCGDTA